MSFHREGTYFIWLEGTLASGRVLHLVGGYTSGGRVLHLAGWYFLCRESISSGGKVLRLAALAGGYFNWREGTSFAGRVLHLAGGYFVWREGISFGGRVLSSGAECIYKCSLIASMGRESSLAKKTPNHSWPKGMPKKPRPL